MSLNFILKYGEVWDYLHWPENLQFKQICFRALSNKGVVSVCPRGKLTGRWWDAREEVYWWGEWGGPGSADTSTDTSADSSVGTFADTSENRWIAALVYRGFRASECQHLDRRGLRVSAARRLGVLRTSGESPPYSADPRALTPQGLDLSHGDASVTGSCPRPWRCS